MFNWAKRSRAGEPSLGTHYRVFRHDGVLVALERGALPVSAKAVASPDMESLLHQLEDEGFAIPSDGGHLIPWERVYELIEHPAYGQAVEVLELPPVGAYAPILESHGSLLDPSFTVAIAGWHDAGARVTSVRLVGGVLEHPSGVTLMSRASFETLRQVSSFAQRDGSERTDTANRRMWGLIRSQALSANARLDTFLYQTVVLSPGRLDIQLRKAENVGTRVIEVQPLFLGAPPNWLEIFDRLSSVPDRYDIPTPNGIVQVLLSPPVKTVLQQIKRMPGRRVAGTRAEAFIANPFAALGEDASAIIDPAQFERAREDAGLTFEHFVAHIKRDALGYPIEVGIVIEAANSTGPASTELLMFQSNDELGAFIEAVQSGLDADLQLCAWEGYDLEFLGDTPREVELLRDAHTVRQKPRVLVSYADVYDLTRYARRVEQIGVDKPYYSPFIAKKQDDEGWFPENVIQGIYWMPPGQTEPVAVPFTEELKEQLKAKCEEAKRKGEASFTLGGFDQPIPVKGLEDILETVGQAEVDIKRGEFDFAQAKTTVPHRDRPSLVIRANIQSVDYEEARRDILSPSMREPELPSALKAGVSLKSHQLEGVAWLQHLFSKAPLYARGAVLADDMGLGKTLQLLTLMAWAHERDPGLEPALVVAPVSLLENWEEEAQRFFNLKGLPILTVYGNALSALRTSRASIDEQLQKEGLVKFLKPGWRGNAKIVLTTYETLRDLEFSFSAERWSVMVCDEAQKIKNPNALVTRSAKKQNVRFKVACTGTPVENTLADLWCLFDFVQPGLLGALNDFSQRYRKPIEAETEEEKARVDELREKIAPQILRRTKADVAKDLPRKVVVESCRGLRLSSYQRALYAQAMELFKRRHEPKAHVPFRNHLGLLQYLRLICTDPKRHGLEVFRPEPLADYRARAPKLDWLLRTLEEIRTKGDKVIIFCEFRNIQRMLRHYITEALNVSPDIINGDTAASMAHQNSRQKRIKAFQANPGFGVIILSPQAVGFGVNVQGANHVVHYTRTWNPAKEDQATDRAYRIGQTKDVFVYYPVASADDFITFDVKLDQLLERKRSLARDMLNGSGDIAPGDFTVEEVFPETDGAPADEAISIDHVLSMRPDYFECLIAALWRKQGYRMVERTPSSGDNGVDVVALKPPFGDLIQCKTSTSEQIGWEAVKDVVAGEAHYKDRYPSITFRKVCTTSQAFNPTAQMHAAKNDVVLVDQQKLIALLRDYPVTMTEVERLLYPTWDSETA